MSSEVGFFPAKNSPNWEARALSPLWYKTNERVVLKNKIINYGTSMDDFQTKYTSSFDFYLI